MRYPLKITEIPHRLPRRQWVCDDARQLSQAARYVAGDTPSPEFAEAVFADGMLDEATAMGVIREDLSRLIVVDADGRELSAAEIGG